MTDVEKMSRKELLQQDRFQKKLYSLVDRVYKKRNWFLGGATVLGVAILVIWGTFEYVEMRRVEQANLFYAARKEFNNPNLTRKERNSLGINSLAEFLEKEGDSPLGVFGWINQGQALFASSRDSEAEAAFQKVLTHPDSSPMLKNIAHINLSAIHEQRDELPLAAAQLDQMTGSEWNDLKWYTKARLAESSGDIETSRKYLTQLVEQTPQSVFRESAETQLLSF